MVLAYINENELNLKAPETILKGEFKMGRMRENPRYNVISMRISDEERENLESLMQRTHKSVSDIMREAMVILSMQLDQQDYRKAA